MAHTYRAILRGDRIEWVDKPPTLGRPTPVEITVLQPEVDDDTGMASMRGKAMADALAALADAGGVSSIPHPKAWQRQVRDDKPQGKEP